MYTYRLYVACWMIMLVLGLHPTTGEARNQVASLPEKSFVPDSVLEHIFNSATFYSQEVKSYKGDLYLKGQLQIHKQNRIIRYIPSMFRLETGVNNYLHESISEFHYTAPSIYDRKIRAVSSTFPSNRGQIFDIFDYMKFNLYAPSVMENKILSPLNRSAKVHYYYLLDSISPQLGSNLYKIRFIPRYHSTQLLEGFIWISSEDWAIRYVNVSGKYDLIHFHLSMKMGDTEESKYLPILLNLTLNFKFLRNHLTMKYTGWMKYNEIVLRKPGEDLAVFRKQKKEHYNLSQSYTLTCDTSRLI